jgi:hypothetical protein
LRSPGAASLIQRLVRGFLGTVLIMFCAESTASASGCLAPYLQPKIGLRSHFEGLEQIQGLGASSPHRNEAPARPQPCSGPSCSNAPAVPSPIPTARAELSGKQGCLSRTVRPFLVLSYHLIPPSDRLHPIQRGGELFRPPWTLLAV